MNIITCVIAIVIMLLIGIGCIAVCVIAELPTSLAITAGVVSIIGAGIWANNLRLAIKLKRLVG